MSRGAASNVSSLPRRLAAAAYLIASTALLTPRAAHAAVDWSDLPGVASPGADLGSTSYSTWSLDGNRVTVRFLLPIAEAQRVAGSDIEVLVQQRMGDYLLAHLGVSAGSAPCEAIDQGYDIGRVDPLTVDATLYGFEIFFQCGEQGNVAQSSGVVLEDHALFERLPGQVGFARVQIANGPFQQELFTPARQQLVLPRAGAPAAAGLGRYFELGLSRLLGRWDHLCFLLAALLLTRRARDSLVLAAGLAGGYAVSLPVAFGAGLVPRGALLGSALGLLVALLAVQRMARGVRQPRITIIATTGALLWLAALALVGHATFPVLLLAGAALFAGGMLGAQDVLTRSALQYALLPALFGFLDGFVLPAALTPQQPANHVLLAMLAGYDLGALFAALMVLALLVLVREALLRGPRSPRLAASRALLADCTGALLAGCGVFWMLSRLHG